jgi:hypothetical protein
LAVIEEQQDPLAMFLYALKAPETKRQYPRRFKVFLDFLKLEGTFEEQTKQFLVKARTNPQWAQDNFMQFIAFQIGRARHKEIAECTISNYYKATKLFCEMNDLTLSWKKISRGLSAIEERFKRIRNDVSILQSQKHTCKRNLYQLNNQIASTTKLLNSLRISCKRERREIENLCNEKTRLESIVTQFRNNNEEYLKIKQAVEEKVKSVLTDSKLILKFATLSVIESLRRNSELYNFISYGTSVETTSTTYGSNYISLLSGRQLHQQSFYDSYTALILEEAEKLYNELIKELTNSVITAAAIRAPSLRLPLPSANNNSQKLNYENDNTYQTEEN